MVIRYTFLFLQCFLLGGQSRCGRIWGFPLYKETLFNIWKFTIYPFEKKSIGSFKASLKVNYYINQISLSVVGHHILFLLVINLFMCLCFFMLYFYLLLKIVKYLDGRTCISKSWKTESKRRTERGTCVGQEKMFENL